MIAIRYGRFFAAAFGRCTVQSGVRDAVGGFGMFVQRSVGAHLLVTSGFDMSVRPQFAVHATIVIHSILVTPCVVRQSFGVCL